MTTLGWTHDQLAELTFPQLRNLLRGGKPEPALAHRKLARQARAVLDRHRAGEL